MTEKKMMIANIIMKMTFGELTELSNQLSSMIEPEIRPIVKTTDEFANLLYDWAEAETTND